MPRMPTAVAAPDFVLGALFLVAWLAPTDDEKVWVVTPLVLLALPSGNGPRTGTRAATRPLP